MRVLTITHSGKEAVGEASYHPPAAAASRSATPPLRPSRRLAVRRRALRRSTAPGTRRLPGALPRPPVRPPDHAGHLPQPGARPRPLDAPSRGPPHRRSRQPRLASLFAGHPRLPQGPPALARALLRRTDPAHRPRPAGGSPGPLVLARP